MNKTETQLLEMYDTLRESIRHYLSLKLMDTNENSPLTCNIVIDFEAFGLSTLNMPTIISMYQHPTEGIIYFKYEGVEEYIEFDNMLTEDLIIIIKYL